MIIIIIIIIVIIIIIMKSTDNMVNRTRLRRVKCDDSRESKCGCHAKSRSSKFPQTSDAKGALRRYLVDDHRARLELRPGAVGDGGDGSVERLKELLLRLLFEPLGAQVLQRSRGVAGSQGRGVGRRGTDTATASVTETFNFFLT